MPRIDPLQLLRCLSVLLGPNGGILSREQVGRLASLMTKFSKKLVSKCIYVLILKNTKTELIGMFMSEGGWALTNSWLADAIEARNWPLMKELLELLLMCPVDVERLKLNNCPKLVKGLSKDTTDRDVQLLATRLVAQWLQIVKSPAPVLHHPTIDTSHLALEPHHSLEREMLPQTSQLQMLEENQGDDGHFNFFPSDSNMQLDIANDLYCDPTDITFDTISKDDLLPASANLCEYRTDNCNSTIIGNGSDLGEIHTEFPGDLVSVNEVRNDSMQEMNFESVIEPAVVSEVTPVPVSEETELMDTDSAVVTNGEPTQEKLVLKLSVLKDGKKVIVKSPTKRKMSDDDEEESSPAKRKARELSRDKKREKEKSDKSSHRHDKTDKKSSSGLSSERRSSKDSTRDPHKSDSRHGDSKSKHHHSDKSKDRSRDKIKDKSKPSSSSSSSSSSAKDKERERAKLKEKEKKLKEKEKAETQAEKDKATLAKVMQPSSVSKLGKIPKKTDSSSKSGEKVHPPVLADSKKISMSIENRKQSGEPRPKTVKTPPTKFRSTGLEDVVKPPPSRKEIKKPATGVPLPGVKESNPLLNVPVLPERRTKPVLNMAGPPERPGAIKLIPAKPKSTGLQDSDFFMDALNAANVKREPRKRKRRISGSKDEPTSPTGLNTSQSEGNESSSPASSPQRPADAKAADAKTAVDKSAVDAKPAADAKPVDAKPVFKFYQETLELNDDVKKEKDEADEEADEKAVKEEGAEEAEVKKEVDDEDKEEKEAALKETTPVGSPVNDEADAETEENNALIEREKNRLPRGVLVFHRSSLKPKKSLKWKADSELEAVQYFELDETERVNVTKTSFMDMKQMERVHERENFHMARRVSGEDQMKEHTAWAPLIPIDLPPSDVEYGSKSREKDVQFAREKMTQASPIYLKNLGNPDSPAEPDPVAFTPTDPVRIPLDDVMGPNSVNDYTNMPWPESKPLLIPQSPPHSHTISHQMPLPSQPLGHALGHHGPALLQTPNIPPTGYHTAGGDWRTGDGKVVMSDMGPMGINPGLGMGSGMGLGMGPVLDGGMGPGMGPGMDMYNQNMDGSWNPDMNYGMMNGQDMYQGMDQGNYDMYQGGAGFGGNQGGSGFSRGRGRGWYRGGSGDSWRGSSRGRGGWSGPGGPSKRVCRYFKRGNCATANCQFLHPPDLKGVSSRH